MFIANYAPKCHMSSGTHGPILVLIVLGIITSFSFYWQKVVALIGLPISFGRPMVFDSLFQKMSQNLS